MSNTDTKENTGSGNTLDSNLYKQEPPDVNNDTKGVVSANDKYFCHNEDHDIPLSFSSKSLKNYHIACSHVCEAHRCSFSSEFNHEIASHYDKVHVEVFQVCDICCSPVTTLSKHKEEEHIKCNSCQNWVMDFPSLKQHEISCSVLHAAQKASEEKPNFISSLGKASNSLYLDKSPAGYNLTQVLSKMINLSSSLSDEEKKISCKHVNAYISQNMLARTRMRRKTPPHKETDLFFSLPSFYSTEESDPDYDDHNSLSSVLKYCKQTIFDGEVDEANEKGWQNYLKLENIFSTIYTVVTTCRLTEPQTVCVLDTMLSSRVKDSVAAYVKCEIPDLTFEKVATTLQYLFVPLDLTKIEKITFGSNKSQSESMFEYAGKIRKSLALCARRLPEESRSSYVEQHMRRLIFNSLDPPLKLKVEKRESIFSPYSSTELLELCLSSNDDDVNSDQYQSLYNVKEESDTENEESDSDSSESCSFEYPEPASNLRQNKQTNNPDPIRSRLNILKTYDSKYSQGLICLLCITPGHNYKFCGDYSPPLSQILHVVRGIPCGWHSPEECMQIHKSTFSNLKKCDEAHLTDKNVSVDQKCNSIMFDFDSYHSD